MDPRLYVAACNGDVATLSELQKENRVLLHNDTLEPSDTVLHISTKLGHANFAKVVMDQNPELATELNYEGFSPIHLASTKGYSQIVADLLNINSNLCFLKDRDGRTPLHCAAIKGRQVVMQQLLSCCPMAAKELTNKEETMLHLAVKNNQCEAIESLVSHLIQINLVDDLVNCVDQDGNTILHLATARKQVQTIKILLRDTKVNVNIVNGNGRTALDIAKLCTSESDDMIIEKMLGEALQPRELELPKEQHIVVDEAVNNFHQDQVENSPRPTPRRRRSPSPSPRVRRSPSPSNRARLELRFESIKNGIIILASMCAAFSFAAALSPPGGLWQDWPSNNNITNITQIPKIANFTKLLFIDPFHLVPKKMHYIGAPYLNFSSPDLYNPGKAMNIALASYDFARFLYSDALCFTSSLLTIVLIIITPALGGFRAMLIYAMTLVIIGSSMFLYYCVLALIANEQFAGWTFKIIARQSFSLLLMGTCSVISSSLFIVMLRGCVFSLDKLLRVCCRLIICFVYML